MRTPHPSFTVAVAASVTLVCVHALQWALIRYLTVFVAMPLFGAAWLFAAAAALLALVTLVLAAFKKSRAAFPSVASLAILLLAVGICRWVPFTRLWLELDYHWHRSDRETVIAMVRAGKLVPRAPETGLVELPLWHRGASEGGQVVMLGNAERPVLLFYTFRGILSHYSGWVFHWGDSTPGCEDFGDRTGEVRPIEPHWWFLSCY